MRTMCIEICFEWLSSMDQATKLEFVVEMLQLRRLLDKTVAAQRHRATAKRLKRQGFLLVIDAEQVFCATSGPYRVVYHIHNGDMVPCGTMSHRTSVGRGRSCMCS